VPLAAVVNSSSAVIIIVFSGWALCPKVKKKVKAEKAKWLAGVLLRGSSALD